MLNKESILTYLQGYREPYLEQDLVSIGALQDLFIKDNKLLLNIQLPFPAKGYQRELKAQLQTYLSQQFPGLANIDITIQSKIMSHAFQNGVTAVPQVKNIIAIASAKGGVGKSTTAVNLALALQAEGARAGILDADIYGPNQPQLLGINQFEQTSDEGRLQPINQYGIQSMSIGYLIDPDSAMIWRGPMVSQALQQLLRETAWEGIDYLLVDLPPGTGDIQLTLAQKIPVSGAVMVTTPQDIALADVRRGIAMFEKVHIPVLGIVENMALHTCSQCGHQEHIFGQGGGARIAKEYGLNLLGSLPLAIQIRLWSDGGKPIVIAEPDSEIANHYRDIARKIAARLSLKPKSFASKFPKLVIEKESP